MKTKTEIRKEIDRLENLRTKEMKKMNGKYVKTMDHIEEMLDRDMRKTRGSELAYKRYQVRSKKVMNEWRKNTNRISDKYESRITTLYKQLAKA